MKPAPATTPYVRPPSEAQLRLGPMRRVVELKTVPGGKFGQVKKLVLECGHEVPVCTPGSRSGNRVDLRRLVDRTIVKRHCPECILEPAGG